MNEYFGQLMQDRTESAKVLEKPSMLGIKLSVVEKYSERAHFIFELIQNADDAKATYIKFLLYSDGLYFIHNGKIKFSVSNPATETEDVNNNQLGHINAITSIGQSAKTENEIGKFGVGFKAVFQYCETPEIYEDDYKFKIERFIIPIRIEKDCNKRKRHETLFYFHFDNPNTYKDIAFADISKKLKSLQNPLLFVNNIEEIFWEIELGKAIETGTYSKEIVEDIQFEDINSKKVVQRHKKSDELLPHENTSQIFSRNILIDNKALSYSIVFFLDQENKIDHSKEYPLYCYFPTQKITKLKYIIQAPFLLVDNRQDIKHNEWNELLIGHLAQLTADSLIIFKQKKLLNDDSFNILPIKRENFESTIFSPFYDLVLLKLKSGAELLPTKEGTFTSFGSCYLSDTDKILNLFTSEQLSDLLQDKKANWIFPSMYGTRRRKNDLTDYVYYNLVEKELLPRDIIEKLRGTFIKKQSDEWLIKFYEVFSNIKEVWELLRYRPIIRTDKNENIIPFNISKELQVFLPSTIESEYPTVKEVFIQDEKTLDFFKELGLREPDLKAEIDNKIFPRYNTQEKIDVKILVNDFEIFFKYFNECPQYDLELYLAKLRKIQFVLVHNPIKEVNYYTEPKNVYFKTKLLEKYFENYTGDIYWLRESKYQSIYQKYGKDKVLSFLKRLGVEDKPRKFRKDITGDYLKRGIKLKARFTKQLYVHDFVLDGLESVLQNITFEKSLILWKFLSESFEYYYTAFRGEHKYFYYSTNYELFSSQILKDLLKSKWIYSETNNDEPEKTSDLLLNEISKKYNAKSENSQKLVRVLIFKTPIKPEKEEWEEYWEPEQRRLLFEHYQKTKDLSDEDLEELIRIKKKRLLLDKSGSPKPTKKGKTVDEIEEGELLDLYALRDLTLNIEHVLKFPFSSIKRTIDDLEENIDVIPLEEIKYGLLNVMYSINQWEKGLDFVISFAPNNNKVFSEIEVTEIIRYVFSSKNKLQIEQENIHITLDMPVKVYFTYNRNYFEDIINNLLDNSIKALKFKEGEKRIKCSVSVEENNLVVLFSDNGIGIKTREREEIFTMYKTKTKELGGLGIGLYIVRTRLSSINGSIEVIENELKPTGATFKIIIPLKHD